MHFKSMLVAFCLALFLFTGCQRELSFENGGDPGTGVDSSITGNFRAMINGNLFVANRITSISRMQGLIRIGGQATDGKSITFTLIDSGVHNYTLYYDNTANNVAVFSDSSLPSVLAFTTNSGTTPGETGGFVNISSIDETNKRMSGTFGFRMKRQSDGLYRNVTAGVFINIPYTTLLGSTNPASSMSVNVNGELFRPTIIQGVVAYDQLILTGYNADSTRSVSLTMPKEIIPGAYTIGSDPGDTCKGIYRPDAIPLNATYAFDGTLLISEHNTGTGRIRGTFSFGADPYGTTGLGGLYWLSDGIFDIIYR